MSRTMYDATHVDVAAIPSAAAMVAGYDTDHTANQSIGWTAADWARFPGAVRVHICGDATDVGDVLDMENGAAAISDAAPWLRARRDATGVWKSLYYSVSLDGQVQAALAAAGIPSEQVPKWVAWYDSPAGASFIDVAHVVGLVAKQYSDQGGGGAYDISIVSDYWPGIDPAPQPQPQPPALEDRDVAIVLAATHDNSGHPTGTYLVDTTNGVTAAIDAEQNLPTVSMSDDAYNSLIAQAQNAAKTGA